MDAGPFAFPGDDVDQNPIALTADEKAELLNLGKCQVCNQRDAIGVASGACGPISIAYCRECLQAGAEPFGLLSGYMGCGGITSPDSVNPEYIPIIEATCRVAGKTMDEFWKACAEAEADINNMGE
jgi:hypothetical protein